MTQGGQPLFFRRSSSRPSFLGPTSLTSGNYELLLRSNGCPSLRRLFRAPAPMGARQLGPPGRDGPWHRASCTRRATQQEPEKELSVRCPFSSESGDNNAALIAPERGKVTESPLK